MPSHALDFTHAFSGRMNDLSPQGSQPVWEALVDEGLMRTMAHRLHGEIAKGALPFLELSFTELLEQELPKAFAKLPPASHMIVLGVGGSSLGARALQKAFAPGQDRPGYTGPWLWVADNIDTDSFTSWMDTLDPRETLVAVISKSGSTIETMAQYCLLKGWLQKHLGADWVHHIIAITDATQGVLRAEADRHGFVSFSVPEALGGRYSIMSAVGMLPAAFMGMDWRAFLRGLRGVVKPLTSPDLKKTPALLGNHPAFSLATWAYTLMGRGYDELIFFNYIPLWGHVGHWFAQLWAESLGKDGKGSMPIPAVGVSDQHSLQQMFLDGKRNKGCLFIRSSSLPLGPLFDDSMLEEWDYLKGRHFGDLLHAEAIGTQLALAHHDVPVVECSLATTNEEACGAFMGLMMLTTLLTGWLLDIHPLDQPAVELGKRLACAELGASGYEAEKDLLQKGRGSHQKLWKYTF